MAYRGLEDQLFGLFEMSYRIIIINALLLIFHSSSKKKLQKKMIFIWIYYRMLYRLNSYTGRWVKKVGFTLIYTPLVVVQI